MWTLKRIFGQDALKRKPPPQLFRSFPKKILQAMAIRPNLRRMAYLTRGPRRFKAWRRRHKLTVPEVARRMGPPGAQLNKWAYGNRETMPIHCVLALCRVTGEPFRAFASREQIRLAADIRDQLEAERAS